MRKTLDRALLGLCLIAATILIVSTCLAAYNTIGRVAFTTSLAWIEELCCYSAGFIMFLMLPFLEYNDRQLSIAFLDEKFKAAGNIIGRKILFYIRGAVTIFAFYMLAKSGYATFTRNFMYGSKSPTLEFPYGILYLILFICVILVLFFWAFHLFLKQWKSKEGGGEIELN